MSLTINNDGMNLTTDELLALIGGIGMIILIIIAVVGILTPIAISYFSNNVPQLQTIYINQSLYPLHFKSIIQNTTLYFFITINTSNTIIPSITINTSNTIIPSNLLFYSNSSDCINRATYQTQKINYTAQKSKLVINTITNLKQIKDLIYNLTSGKIAYESWIFKSFFLNRNPKLEILMSASNTPIYTSNNYTFVCPINK